MANDFDLTDGTMAPPWWSDQLILEVVIPHWDVNDASTDDHDTADDDDSDDDDYDDDDSSHMTMMMILISKSYDHDDETDDDNDHKKDSYTAAGATSGASFPGSSYK